MSEGPCDRPAGRPDTRRERVLEAKECRCMVCTSYLEEFGHYGRPRPTTLGQF